MKEQLVQYENEIDEYEQKESAYAGENNRKR